MSLSKSDEDDQQIMTDDGMADEQRADDVTERRRTDNGDAESDRLSLPLVSQR